MKGDAKPLLKFMDGSDTRFVIPVYQRNYDWKIENCKQLFDDLLKVIAEDRESHFFGSVVASTEGSDYIIIDGQQRITTTSLLLLALVNLISGGEIESDVDRLDERIKKAYLVDEWNPTERKAKLKPVKNDMRAFDQLFKSQEDYIMESNVTQNYLFFREAILKSNTAPSTLFNAIKKLRIIDITLEQGDNPQLIFESLNSTGMDLSEADKIRNYILMGLPKDKQEELYEDYWINIERLTGYQVSEFIRQYLTYKQAKWPNISKVYTVFKEYAPDDVSNMESLLSDMKKYARYYKLINDADSTDQRLNVILERLGRLDMSVINPFLFAVFDSQQEGLLNTGEVYYTLQAVETYLFRRFICDLPTNALNKTFASLHNETIRLLELDDKYVDALIYVLSRKTASGRFPSDEEFETKIRTRDFYNMRQKNRVYYFDRLVNGDTREIINVPAMMAAKEQGLTIEHIMPQSLTKAWREDLGSDYEVIHEEWNNKIANLTLTGYNSEYSNRRFTDKLTMEKGFKESTLPINKWIAEQAKWTLEELEKREDLLVSQFLELWELPQTDFLPAPDASIEYSLDDEFDFTGTKIISYVFMGDRQKVKSWREAYEGMIRQLYELDPSALYVLVEQEKFPGSYFLDNDDTNYSVAKIGSGIYTYTGTSTATKVDLMSAVLEKAGIDATELSFEIKDE